MGLPSVYTVAINRIADLFQKVRDGQAPEQFTQQLLKDWGFVSTNDRAFIPILKALGFLTPDGKPTSIYHEYRDHSRSKKVLGRALRQTFADIFLIKEHPTPSDRDAIQGKFKSFHNTSDHVAALMARTFMALLALADISTEPNPQENKSGAQKEKPAAPEGEEDGKTEEEVGRKTKLHAPGLHYNIQIHLPATKDIEVYNAIFKSLKEHLFEA